MDNTEERNENNMKDSSGAVQKSQQSNFPQTTQPQTGVPEKKNQNRRFFKRNRNFKKYHHRQNQQYQGLNLNNKMISIVIPLYNEEESIVELSIALKKVLESLKANYEVIFIDDGSTDNSYNKI